MSWYALKGKREFGLEQPYAAGRLKIRVPFIHYPFEFADFVQGAILCVVPMGITAAMTEILGIPFEIAIAMVILNNFMYLLHTHFGDPAIAGWITPGIPLFIAFISLYEPGVARMHALIALQMTVGGIFLFLGITGLAQKVVKAIPTSMKAGILLGAAFASLKGEFSPGGRIEEFTVSIILGLFISFFMLFSTSTGELRKRYSLFRYIAQFGIAIPFFLAYVIGIFIGEVAVPQISFSITPIPIAEMVNTYSIFNLGFPHWSYFTAALPLAISAYIIAFGDVLVATGLLKASDEKRKDEKIVWEPNRNHYITSFRNLIQAFFSAYLPLAGPQWAAGQALVTNRYMNSTQKEEDTYWGGATSLYWGMSIALLLGPLVSFFRPGMAIGLSITLLLQGFLCGYLAMAMVTNNLQRGIAVIMGAVLAVQGAAWGLGIGIALYILLEYQLVKPKIDPEELEERRDCSS